MKLRQMLPFCVCSTFLILSCYSTAKIPSVQKKDQAVYAGRPWNTANYEGEILSYLNELRRDPPGFYHKYVKEYLRKKSNRFTSYYSESLRRTLLRQASLPPFQSNSTLKKLAAKQLHYLVHTLKGKALSHNQGSVSFAERIKGTGLHCFAENLYRFPHATPLEVVLDLLIDQGVSSLGHRKNMLNPMYTLIGITSATAPNHYKITVMDFGCQK